MSLVKWFTMTAKHSPSTMTEMKLQDIHQATSLATERGLLTTSIRSISQGHDLGVTINGRYQSDAMLDAVRPSVLAHLQQLVDAIDAQLSALGVEVGGE